MSSSILPSLKNTFGEIPSLVYEHLKYFSYNENREEFTCTLCKRVIQKMATKNMEAHLKSVSHRAQSCSTDQLTRALTKPFQGKIPQIVQNNIHVLDVDDEGYKCMICVKLIKISKDSKISVDIFSYHLLSSGHEESLEEYKQKIEQLKDVYGGIPEVVDNNKEFLVRSGKNYVCTLCNVLLKVNKNNIQQTENTFEEHFFSAKHFWSVKRSKVLALIPELEHSKSTIHTYLMRNIEYISHNGTDFFCSLCHENIKRSSNDVNETEENLKYHILSSTHEKNVYGRQNQGNEKLDNFHKVIDVFEDDVLKNLRYLELSGSSFICCICNEELNTESELDCDELNNILLHFESYHHKENVSEEEQRQIHLTEKLENVFGKIPSSVEENIEYIEFVKANSVQCTLCETTFPLRELECHLISSDHKEALEGEDSASDSLHEYLEDLFGPDYEEKIPDCIHNNWSQIECERDSGDFCCTLCDETIIVDEGNKQEEITFQNFKNHLFSSGHTTKLKQKVKKEKETSEKLESIFGGIPKCILSNLYVLHEKDNDSFSCHICDVEIRLGSYVKTTIQNFLQHLRGSLHKSNIEDSETAIDNAFKLLDEKFGVPEFLLRDIDFWDNSVDDPDLYCTLCQQDLSVDLDDLKRTRRSLECHMDSEQHKSNLQNF